MTLTPFEGCALLLALQLLVFLMQTVGRRKARADLEDALAARKEACAFYEESHRLANDTIAALKVRT